MSVLLAPSRRITHEQVLAVMATIAPCSCSSAVEAAAIARFTQRPQASSADETQVCLAESRHDAPMRRMREAINAWTDQVSMTRVVKGFRSQFDTYRVMVPVTVLPVVEEHLDRQWSAVTASLRQRMRAVRACGQHGCAARTVWRCAYLVAATGRSRHRLAVAAPNAGAATALCHAATALGLSAGAARRPGGHSVTVEGDDQARAMLAALGADVFGRLWVDGR